MSCNIKKNWHWYWCKTQGNKKGQFQFEGFILFRDSRFVNFNVRSEFASQQKLPH